ncbi:MAG: hypothetical protein ACETWE_14400 [Candidatus Bathyarchaeia archaeon]
MVDMWTSFYFANAIPELETEPIRTILHITAEIATGVSLMIGGYGLYRNLKWGSRAYLLSMGMLLYTLTVSRGYYAQKGVIEFVEMFVIFIIISIVFIALSFLKPREFEAD